MKNKINIYICDDNVMFVDKIRNKINLILSENHRPCNIAVFLNATDLISQFRQHPADVVFLDIDMPSISGFEAAEKLQTINENVFIIFVTSHEEMVFQSYEFHPFWFVRKAHLDDLDIILPKLFVKIDFANTGVQNVCNLITDNGLVKINIYKVKYITARDHYISIRNSDDTEKLERCKISDAEKQLSPYFFVRVQNSVLVNCRFITKVTSRAVILHSNETISISRGKIDVVKNEFLRYMRSA